MQVSSCRPLWLHLRTLTLVLLLVVCGRFGAGEGIELKIKPEDSSFTRARGSSFVFTCEISGANSTTNYHLKWFHNSSEITSRTASRMYVEDEGTVVRKLYITGFEKQDEGVYKCTGMIEGTVWEKSTNVFLFKDITFDHAPEVQHPAIYTDAVIECRASGRPTPEVSWRYKGDRILTGGRYEIVDEGLRIINITLKDDGIYICRAEVEMDGRYGEQKITVAVHSKPSPIQITSESKTEAGRSYTIAWKKPITGGLPIKEYEFKFRTVSLAEDGSGDKKFGEWQSHIRLDDVNKPMLTYQLYRLTPSTTYDLQVRARNDLGWSDAAEFQFETREGVELTSEGARDEASTSFLYLFNFLLLKTVVHGIPV